MGTFSNALEVQNRLRSGQKLLSEDEVRAILPLLPELDDRIIRNLWGHVALLAMEAIHQNIAAIERFERSSSKWTRLLTILTAALVGLTLVLIWLTSLLV